MWLGESTHALDDKGRLSVPRRFLPGKGGADAHQVFILTQGFEGALFLFTEESFRAAIARLETQPFAGAEKRNMQRLFFAKAQRLELDDKNRLLLPPELKELAGIEREIVIVGLMERAEIWSKSKWDAFQVEHRQEFERLDRVLTGGADAPAV